MGNSERNINADASGGSPSGHTCLNPCWSSLFKYIARRSCCEDICWRLSNHSVELNRKQNYFKCASLTNVTLTWLLMADIIERETPSISVTGVLAASRDLATSRTTVWRWCMVTYVNNVQLSWLLALSRFGIELVSSTLSLDATYVNWVIKLCDVVDCMLSCLDVV